MATTEAASALLYSALAVLFAALGAPTIAEIFAIIAVVASGFAIHRVNELGKIVESKADRQALEIEDLPRHDDD